MWKGIALRPDRAFRQIRSPASEWSADAFQAFPDTACMARRPPAKGALQGVLPMRRRRGGFRIPDERSGASWTHRFRVLSPEHKCPTETQQPQGAFRNSRSHRRTGQNRRHNRSHWQNRQDRNRQRKRGAALERHSGEGNWNLTSVAYAQRLQRAKDGSSGRCA